MAIEIKQNTKVVEMLNKHAATWTVMYMKLHNYHWFVKGPNFFDLHVKLEELYNEAAENLDTVAERILAIGGKPVGTLQEALGLSVIKEASGKEDTRGMIEQLIQDYEKMVDGCKEGIEVAEEAGDPSTADMLTQTVTDLEKTNWMLRSYLG